MNEHELSTQPDSTTKSNGAHPEEAPVSEYPKAEQDLKPCNVDGEGNRLPWSYPCSVPTVDKTPLDKTPLFKAIEDIRSKLSVRGSILHHDYDHKLQHALKRVEKVRKEEEDAQRARNARAIQRNKEIAARQKEITDLRDAATKSDRAALKALDAPLHEKHLAAVKRVSATGGTYDPENPTDASVLRVEKRSLREVAADLMLPWTPADPESLMPTGIKYFVILMEGVILGFGLAIISGFLHPDTPLNRQGINLVIWLLIGIAIAVVTKYAAMLPARIASERYHLGHKMSNWLPFVLIAVGAILIGIKVDSIVGKEGFLKLARISAGVMGISGGSGQVGADQDATFTWISVVFAMPYLSYAAWEGYLIGRKDAVMNRLEGRQASEFTAALTERREQEDVREALCAIGEVNVVLSQKKALEERIVATAEPFEREIAELQARRLPEDQEMSEVALRRHQDAVDRFHWAQTVFDTKLDKAAEIVEPTGDRLTQAWQALRGSPTMPRSPGIVAKLRNWLSRKPRIK